MPITTPMFYRSLDMATKATTTGKTANRKLGALCPTPLRPCHVAKKRGLDTVRTLQQIEFLAVRKTVQHHTDQAVYWVDIYNREKQSRIPVHRLYGPTSEPTRGAPSFSLQFGFSDFLQLSRDAYELTHRSHIVAGCAFCRDMLFYNKASDLKPRRKMHWFKSDDNVCEILTEYLNAVLAQASAVPTMGNVCPGQKRVSQLLQQFLWASENDRQSI